MGRRCIMLFTMALIKCAECGQMVSDKAANCPNCGCPVEREVICEECGRPIYRIKFCTYCGCPVKKEQTENAPANNICDYNTPTKHSKFQYYILGIVGYIVLSTIICAWVRETYDFFTSTQAKIEQESMVCMLVASFILLIVAKPWVEKIVFPLLAIFISFVCALNSEQLMYGTAIIQFLSHFSLIIIAIIRR